MSRILAIQMYPTIKHQIRLVQFTICWMIPLISVSKNPIYISSTDLGFNLHVAGYSEHAESYPNLGNKKGTTNINRIQLMLHVRNMHTNLCPCPKSPSFVGFYIPAPWFAYGNRRVSPNYVRQRIGILSTGTFLIISPKSNKNWKSPKIIQCGPPKIAKLVQITPITMVYGTQITIVMGVYKPTSLGGPQNHMIYKPENTGALYPLMGHTLWWTNILLWKITIFYGKIHYK